MSTAICDPDAFYPLRNLIKGPFSDLSQLPAVEQLVRAIVLHDEIIMEPAPLVYDELAEMEAEAQGFHTFKVMTNQPGHVPSSELGVSGIEVGNSMRILGLAPITDDYLVFSKQARDSHDASRNINLSKALLEHAARHSNAGPGNIYYENHLRFLQQIAYVEQHGGSAVVASEFGAGSIEVAQKFPQDLFSILDGEWQDHAREIHNKGVNFMVPPVLGIVLDRCRSRDEIPLRLKEIRDEWAPARREVWRAIKAYRDSKTISEMLEIERELLEASKYFSPKVEIDLGDRAVRIVWDILAGSSIGWMTGNVADKPLTGALSGMIIAGGKSVKDNLYEVGRCLFGRGALDLANKVRLGVNRFDPRVLSGILSDAEKRTLEIH